MIVLDISPEESFLIQAHALAECYVKLGELEVSKDPLILDNIDRVFGQTGKIMAQMEHSVFQGQGALISVFYMFLVLPHEWQEKGIGDFRKLDLSCPEAVARANAVVTQDYKDKNYPALKHFRNALAHGRINWSEGGKLVIADQNEKGEKYCAEYSMGSLGELAQSLNMAIADYIETVIKQRKPKA